MSRHRIPSDSLRAVTAAFKPLTNLLLRVKPKRRWTQFSLGTLFLVVTVLCVTLTVVVVPAERERKAVAAIGSLGGRVYYVPGQWVSQALPMRFLRRWLPPDYFAEVQVVNLYRSEVTDAGLVHLKGLSSLQSLSLFDTRITDAGRKASPNPFFFRVFRVLSGCIGRKPEGVF